MFNDILIEVGNEPSFLVDNLYMHKSCIEINVHEVYRDTLTHFITTLWVKPSLNGQAHEVMDDDGNRYKVESVIKLDESRKSTLGITV